MPAPLTYPGVYIEELPSSVRTITGVATSITAFVGRAWRGPVDDPVMIFSFADYERQFGGLWRDSTMSYAVQQFFQNGGSQALIVRVTVRTGAKKGKIATAALTNGEQFAAANEGSWAHNLVLDIDLATSDPADPKLFNLTVYDDPLLKNDAAKRGGSGLKETFRNLSVDLVHPRYAVTVLEQQSQLVRATTLLAAKPAAQTGVSPTGGSDGDAIGSTEVTAPANQGAQTGLYALDKADLFNLLCIPPFEEDKDNNLGNDWTPAATYCAKRRAFLIVDAPAAWSVATGAGGFTLTGPGRSYGAVYFPRLLMPDPLAEGALRAFAPGGAVAGVMSRTDAERGVWKAPAGADAGLAATLGLAIAGQSAKLSNDEIGQLNPVAVNCLRNLPTIGHVVWGARTLEGPDRLASQWKYVPVRRLALFIEESLFRGTQWVVFEPNDEPLWAQIRLNIGGFMHTLFRKGAFQGLTPKDAYFVQCNSQTTTQTDIDNGVVNIIVGFAPLKPAEFVVIKIQQISPQS